MALTTRETWLAGAIFMAVFLSAGSASGYEYPPHERPMYGGIVKNEAMKAADEAFIKDILSKGLTREAGSDRMANLGWDYFFRGDIKTAIRRFNQAWLLDPENGEAYHGFAVVVIDRDKDIMQGERFFRTAVEKPRQLPGAYLDYGRFLIVEKRPREALAYLSKASTMPNVTTGVHALLAMAHYDLGEISLACAAGRRMKEDAPDNLQNHVRFILKSGKC